MTPGDLHGLLDFLRAAEALKHTLRSGHTSTGRQESVADHTWRLCLMALVFEETFPEVDFARLIRMCLVHDLGEALSGDIPAPEQAGQPSKADAERRDLLTLLEPLPARLRDAITALWDDYARAASPEARLARGLDKLETILQHNQGRNPAGFDYRFNLSYGARYTQHDPRLAAIRAVLDAETAQRARDADREAPPSST